MSREALHFRKQAERAERLARSVLDDQASKQLVEASKEFRRKAEQLQKRPNKAFVADFERLGFSSDGPTRSADASWAFLGFRRGA